MKNNKLMRALTILGLFCANLLLAQSTISGSVTDAETNEPIPGVNIVIQGTTEGTNTDFDGNFSLSTNRAVPFTIEVSSVGFGSKSIEVTAADQALSISLDAGENLEEIIVSASRRPQKVQDAPASVSVLSAKDVENSAVAVDPVRHLVNVPGVQIQQSSANSLNVEMRAGAGVFGTSTFMMLDYRFLVDPAGGTFFSFQQGMSNIDIERIEVIRGPAGALYGPGVSSGIVHFMSKSAIDHPGTTVELIGGELSTLGATVRHAYANEDKTFGYKINARYIQGDDFGLDAEEDAEFIADQFTTISEPDITPGGYIDSTSPGTPLLGLTQLDDDNDGNPLATTYENYSINAHFEFRPNEKTEAVLAGGYNHGEGLFFQALGPGRAAGNLAWGQARLKSGGFFGQVYYSHNDGGDTEWPNFLYSTGFRQEVDRKNLEAQLQYNFETPGFLNSYFTVGGDYRNVVSDSERTLFGRYEEDDDYSIMGAYFQGTSSLSDKLELTYTVRYDNFNIFDDGLIAPRAALVYKASENSTFRVSYNRSAFGPSSLEYNIDFPVSILSQGDPNLGTAAIDVWLSGQAENQNFSNPNALDLSITPFEDNLPNNTPGLPLAYAYSLVAQPVIAGIAGAVGPVWPIIEGFFNGYVPADTNAATAFGGTNFYGFNLFNREPMSELTGTTDARPGYVDSFEVGYSGIIGKKLKVGLDVYTYERTGFSQFTAIGPTLALLGAQNIPAALGTQIGLDFAASPQFAALVGAVGAPTAQAIAGQISQGFGGAMGQALAALPPAAFQVIGTIESDRVPADDGVMHIPAGYRRFDDATRSHIGADLSLEYFANEYWSYWGNASWVSQNEWIPGEDNDDDLPFSDYLNIPQFKYRLGVRYSKDKWRGSLSFQHDDEFNTNQGVFVGVAQEKNLFDLNIGHDLTDNIKLDLQGSNIFNNEYRALPNFPIIGRRILLKATLNF